MLSNSRSSSLSSGRTGSIPSSIGPSKFQNAISRFVLPGFLLEANILSSFYMLSVNLNCWLNSIYLP